MSNIWLQELEIKEITGMVAFCKGDYGVWVGNEVKDILKDKHAFAMVDAIVNNLQTGPEFRSTIIKRFVTTNEKIKILECILELRNKLMNVEN